MAVEPFRRQVVGVFLVVPACDAELSGIGHLAADTSQQVPDFLEERRSVQSGDSWAGASGSDVEDVEDYGLFSPLWVKDLHILV